MAIAPRELRQYLGHVTTGVTVITCASAGRRAGPHLPDLINPDETSVIGGNGHGSR